MSNKTAANTKFSGAALLFLVGLAGWWIPGTGHLLINRPKRGLIIFIAISFTVFAGLWIGSIAVIDAGSPWYWAQLLNSPAIALLGKISTAENIVCFGKPREIGQIYTGVAGLLNLLCVTNAVYLAHCKNTGQEVE